MGSTLEDSRLDAVFTALSDRTRRDIVARLSAGEATVKELAEPYAMSMQAVSQHIRVLERSGLVSRVVPADKLMQEALSMAEKIASMSRPAAAMAKSAINRAFETPLSEGLEVERDLFHSTFALEDRSEGMAAFIEKRKPVNKNR